MLKSILLQDGKKKREIKGEKKSAFKQYVCSHLILGHSQHMYNLDLAQMFYFTNRVDYFEEFFGSRLQPQ